jgi:hypothetical protein
MNIKILGLSCAALAMLLGGNTDDTKSAVQDEGVPVAVGDVRAATLPQLIKVDRYLPHATMTKRVEEMLKKHECTISDQRSDKFDVVVPYAILLGDNGTVEKIVVQDTACQPLTMLVAEVVVSRAARGDFIVPDGRINQWFGSDVYFKNVEPTASEVAADPGKVTCKSSPKLGSRLSVNRVCKTAAEWAAYDKDRQQLKRDIGNSGACLGNKSCSSE